MPKSSSLRGWKSLPRVLSQQVVLVRENELERVATFSTHYYIFSGPSKKISMTTPTLGRLEKVDLRVAWQGEASHFTPWLAMTENIDLLSETIDMDLEVEAQERNVGPFRADILCKDLSTADEHWVLIENQLERTDHSHLGQLITYAAGLQAVTIVWIAQNFTSEHRAALDWLNEVTSEEIRFFGLEVELWRIGNSPIAPKFNVVSSPNNWKKNVKRASKVIEESELSDLRKFQKEFWEEFLKQLQPVYLYARNITAKPQQWLGFPIGRSGQAIGAKIDVRKKTVAVSLECNGPNAKKFYNALEQNKVDVERDFGGSLIWEYMPESIRSKVSVSASNMETADKSNWQECFHWLTENLIRFDRAIRTRLRDVRIQDENQDDATVESDSIP